MRTSAQRPDKGKPGVTRGRKAMGPGELRDRQAAGPGRLFAPGSLSSPGVFFWFVRCTGKEEGMKEKLVVAPRGSAWEVRSEHEKRFTSLHKTKDLAVETANREAKKKHTTVMVAAKPKKD